MNDDFYDKCYEAWRHGHNPDSVSHDEYDRLLSRGYYPEDISWMDLLPEGPEPWEEPDNE